MAGRAWSENLSEFLTIYPARSDLRLWLCAVDVSFFMFVCVGGCGIASDSVAFDSSP